MKATSPGFSYEGAQTATSVAVYIFVRVLTVRTNVYIDGFNFYYGALRGTPFKWLNLRRFSEVLFPDDAIGRICYFTARLETHSGDGGPRHRQGVYLDALKTLPNVEIILGTFRRRIKRRPLLEPLEGFPQVVTITEWEEKKTDVNLATEMIFDGFNRTCDQAVIVSNDTDLVRSIQRMRHELGIKMVVVNPYRLIRTPRELYRAADRVLRVRDSHLVNSMLPNIVIDSKGREIRKPATW